MFDSIKNTQTHVARYFFVDGTLEFSLAFISALLAVYFFIEERLSGLARVLVDISLILIIFLGSLVMRKIIRVIKEQITYKRTGYIEYRRKNWKKRKQGVILGILLGGVTAVITSYFVIKDPEAFDVIPVINGLGFFIVLSLVGWRARIYHFFLLGGLCLLAGIVSATGFIAAGLSGYYLMVTVMMLISGGITLWIYLHFNPVKERTPDEK